MQLLYISNARIPTEKAHGLTIAKSCEAFAGAGADVCLVIPRRRTTAVGDVFSAYSLPRTFKVVTLPTIDAVWWSSSRAAFIVQSVSFYASVFFYVLFRRRVGVIVYTREPQFLRLSRLGFRVVYECHHIFERSERFFSLSRRAERIVTISRSLKQIFAEHGLDEQRILVAPSGVDLSLFDIAITKEEARRQLELPLSAKIALYTGNFTTMGEDKGIDDIIRALKDAPDVLFVAVGGSEKDRAHYASKAREANVSARVILRGYTPQALLAVYQKAADVLLMPFPDTPHYREHMSPVKMFEYMASGTPIIASDLPTIREVLNEKNSVIVPPADPAAIGKEMSALCADLVKSAVLAGRAREEVEAYTWDARAGRILGFLE